MESWEPSKPMKVVVPIELNVAHAYLGSLCNQRHIAIWTIKSTLQDVEHRTTGTPCPCETRAEYMAIPLYH